MNQYGLISYLNPSHTSLIPSIRLATLWKMMIWDLPRFFCLDFCSPFCHTGSVSGACSAVRRGLGAFRRSREGYRWDLRGSGLLALPGGEGSVGWSRTVVILWSTRYIKTAIAWEVAGGIHKQLEIHLWETKWGAKMMNKNEWQQWSFAENNRDCLWTRFVHGLTRRPTSSTRALGWQNGCRRSPIG